MRRLPHVLVPALVALPVLAACGTTGEAGRVDAILALEGDPVTGADVYDAECSVCHGLDGEGGSGPSMAAAIGPHDRASLIEVVLDGVGSMPSFDDLPDQDIADLATYLEDTF